MIPLGVLLLLWKDGTFLQTCPECGGTAYIAGFGGSPLSGTNSWWGGCPSCGKRVRGSVKGRFTDFWPVAHKKVREYPNEDTVLKGERPKFSWSKGSTGVYTPDRILKPRVRGVTLDELVETLQNNNKRKESNGMIEKALIFAASAHEGQPRKSTEDQQTPKIPYIMHPMEAGVIAAGIKFDEDLVAAAILHDTIEDSGVGYDTLKNDFNERVAELVSSVSEDKSKSWEERKQHTVDQVKAETDEDVLILTLSDKLSNIRSIYRDCQTLGDELWKRFRRGKEQQKWYYTELVEGLKALDRLPEYKEFRELVKAVFGLC
jgi:hypothetical protein